MRRGVGLHIADIAIFFGQSAGTYEFEVGQPIRKLPTQAFGANAVAMHNDREEATGKVLGEVPNP